MIPAPTPLAPRSNASASVPIPHRFAPRLLWFALYCLPVFAFAQLPAADLPTLAPMIERVSPTVVNISVSSEAPTESLANPIDPVFPYPDDDAPTHEEINATGSGVVVDSVHGYILTNQHVIQNADRITVTLLDNRSMQATVVGSDPGTDLAVLKVDARDLKAAQFGDSDKLRVGDFVVAIGNPFGLSHTVTSGIVSGLGRTGIDPNAYEDFIQTDASINPGNSGGALVDLSGKLVGINAAIVSRSGGSVGIGFAIPVNMARSIMRQLIDYGKVSRGLLGVSIKSVTPAIAGTYGIENAQGALVMAVSPESAAEKAGIQINDIIVGVNRHPILDSGSLKAAIGLNRPGAQITLAYIRNGHQRTVQTKLGEAADAQPARLRTSAQPKAERHATLDQSLEGAQLVELSRSRSANRTAGLFVKRMEAGSPAAIRGLREGDLITRIDRQRVRSLDDAAKALDGARTVILEVQRNGRGLLLLMR